MCAHRSVVPAVVLSQGLMVCAATSSGSSMPWGRFEEPWQIFGDEQCWAQHTTHEALTRRARTTIGYEY